MARLLLTDKLSSVVGAKTATALEAGLGLRTIEDLLRHYPRRYAERGQLTDLASLEIDEHVTVMARVQKAENKSYQDRRTGRRAERLEVVVTDGTGKLTLTFFKQSWRVKDLREGRIGLFSGKVGAFRGNRQLTHPDYVLLPDVDQLDDAPPIVSDEDTLLRYAGQLIPVYPATAQMASWKIASAVAVVLDQLPDDLDDPIPVVTRVRHSLPDLRGALVAIHRPESRDDVASARARLRWDEAFVLQTVLAQRRLAASALPATPRVPAPGGLLDEFEARLPFQLTDGQRAVGRVVSSDLARAHPMHRLLQGEVGSGKTLVALRAMLAVVDSGGQAALLAPTEVLAQQHHRSITTMLGPLAERGLLGGSDAGTRIALLTGSLPAARRKQELLDIASGEAGIVVGTHALLEDKVSFFDLGLVVVDEQHRFGVEQRDGDGGQVARRLSPARPRDDRDADPADGGHDRVRRSGGVDPHRAPARSRADHDSRGARIGEASVPRSRVAADHARRCRPGDRPTSSSPASAATETPTRMSTSPRTPSRSVGATARGARRGPIGCARDHSRVCVSACCTAGFPPTRRTT